MRQLLEEGVFAPHGLSQHLGQLHGSQGGREPAVTTEHVHTGLDQTNRLHKKKDIFLKNQQVLKGKQYYMMMTTTTETKSLRESEC